MKCLACDVILNNKEATRKFPSGEFVDLCEPCYETIKEDVDIIESTQSEEEEEDA